VSPFISIVLTGRNDEHGTDFRTRFFRTLAFNLRELAARGISHEIVFVEWAPDHGRARLVDLVFNEVTTASPANFRGYVVDSRYQAALSQNPQLAYLEFVAKNVGVRRAGGRFVLATNCDVLLSRHVLDRLQREALEPRTLYRAARHDLKLGLDSGGLSWALLEDGASLETNPPVLEPPYMAGATGDFVLLERESFHELRGFNQVYRCTRIGVDANFLVKALSDGIRIVDIGGPVYHVNHADSYRLSRHVYAGREADAPWGDIRWHSRGVVYTNPDDWGLAAAPELTINESTRQLDFDWRAVSPLVDLRRVVLPMAHGDAPSPGRYVRHTRGS
jgi:hypothetical protein